MTTTLLVPGLDGSTGGHWQQWWHRTDADSILVEFTDLGDPVPAAMEMELISAKLTIRAQFLSVIVLAQS